VDSGSLFHLLHHCGIKEISYHFSYSHSPIVIGEMTYVDKSMNPKHFGSDQADFLIRIKIDQKIRIRIQDHFRLTFRPWWSLRSLSAVVYV